MAVEANCGGEGDREGAGEHPGFGGCYEPVRGPQVALDARAPSPPSAGIAAVACGSGIRSARE